MKTTVCTLMWGSAYERYGRKFLETFERYWPRDIDLVVVVDRKLDIKYPQALLRDIPAYNDFMLRWSDEARANGKGIPGAKVDENGVSWRHNAVKWMPQGVAPFPVIEELRDGEIFVWLDADVETTAPVPDGWIDDILGNHDVACLQREQNHSEIGFYALRVGYKTLDAMREFSNLYSSGRVFDLPQWHSAYVWDRAIGSIPNMKVKNLSPGRRGHVFPGSVLAECLVHKKGKRKGA